MKNITVYQGPALDKCRGVEKMTVYQELAFDKCRGIENMAVYQEPALDKKWKIRWCQKLAPDKCRGIEKMAVYQELAFDKHGKISVLKSWLLIIEARTLCDGEPGTRSWRAVLFFL